MIEVAPGLGYYPDYLDPAEQRSLLGAVYNVIAAAPLFTPHMPKTGKPFSVRMTNCGTLGWVSDATKGYRYQPNHPVSGSPWPAIPEEVKKVWAALSQYPLPPEACLINFYNKTARMGLHQDRDETDFSAPVLSISLGADCLFRFGGHQRKGPTQSLRLRSGDVIVLGGASRLVFHGVDRIYPGTSQLVEDDGRINLTLRRVNL